DEDLELGQSVELELEDRVGLLGVERKLLDQLLGGVGLTVALADELDDLVEDVENLLEAFENVDASAQCSELVFETPGHDLPAEMQEVPEDGVEIEPFRPAHLGVFGGHEAGHVHR